MQFISVEINQHKISMKELCSKVLASFAVLGLVGGSIGNCWLWGGGVIHHLFPLLVEIKVEEDNCTPPLQELSAYFIHLNEIPSLPLPAGIHILPQAFLALLQGSRPPLFVQSFSLGAIFTLPRIMSLTSL